MKLKTPNCKLKPPNCNRKLLASKLPSNNKKQSSTWPLMPSKGSVKQELGIIAGALFMGSR